MHLLLISIYCSTVRINGCDLPIHYRVSAVWAGRSGPLLLWIAWLSAARLWWRYISDKETEKKKTGTGGVLHFLTFCLFFCFLLEPFALDNSPPRTELNVFLQTDLMVSHPPIVFAFYALCLVVSSLAMEGILNETNPLEIHQDVLPLARAAFFAGTLGIGLGGLWAYTVFGLGRILGMGSCRNSIITTLAVSIIVDSSSNVPEGKE